MERKRSASRRYKPLGEKIKDSLRHFVAFMFSNVGIIGLVVGYTIVGALVFKELEGDSKIVVRKEESADRLRNATAESLWNVTCCWIIPLREDVFLREANKLIEAYQKDFVSTMKGSGSDSGKSTDNWSFSGAFLYSLTVITTIGYGNVTPRTEVGKITTVLYAIIGMPLFLLYLSNIGDILAKSFKWTYAKLWLCKGCPGARRRRLARAMQHDSRLASKHRHSVKSLPPAAADFGDNHSWTPGAHPAAHRAVRRGRPGVHDFHDGYPEPPSPRQRAARGRRGPRAHHEYEEDDERRWGSTPRSARSRRVGVVEYGGAAVGDLAEDDWESSPRSRSRSRSAFRQGAAAGAGGAGGAGGYQRHQRGRTPVSVSPADLNGGWAGGPRWSRGRSAEIHEDTDLEMGYATGRGRHLEDGGHRGAARPQARRPRRRRREEEIEEEEEEESGSSDDSDVEDEDAEEEEEEAEEEEATTLSDEEAEEEEEEDEGEEADGETNSSSESGETYDPQTVTVPVTLCLAIMVGYVCAGALMFINQEHWDMLDSSYFCFISLSTIGFGDFVPGNSYSSGSIDTSFILCSLYLMMGMALIAMCFNLMQEEVIHKIRSCIRTIRYVTRCNRRRQQAAS